MKVIDQINEKLLIEYSTEFKLSKAEKETLDIKTYNITKDIMIGIKEYLKTIRNITDTDKKDTQKYIINKICSILKS